MSARGLGLGAWGLGVGAWGLGLGAGGLGLGASGECGCGVAACAAHLQRRISPFAVEPSVYCPRRRSISCSSSVSSAATPAGSGGAAERDKAPAEPCVDAAAAPLTHSMWCCSTRCARWKVCTRSSLHPSTRRKKAASIDPRCTSSCTAERHTASTCSGCGGRGRCGRCSGCGECGGCAGCVVHGEESDGGCKRWVGACRCAGRRKAGARLPLW